MDVGLLLLRLVVGGLFIGHGSQKLFGSFGGHGLEGTGSFMGKLGYRPGRPMAALAGFAELASGALLLLGFFTPFAAAGIIGVMFNAIISVHWRNGVWNQDGGIEYPLVLCTVAAAVLYPDVSGRSARRSNFARPRWNVLGARRLNAWSGANDRGAHRSNVPRSRHARTASAISSGGSFLPL